MIAGAIRLATGVHARWVGCGPEAIQRIYFANHGSNLDAPAIWSSLPASLRRRTRPVAARDYWDATTLRRWLAKRVFRVVLIPRSGITARDNPLDGMSRALDQGDSLIIFPEGTRTLDDDGAMGMFKPGLWHLARRHPQVDLVPVWLENLNRILPKGEYLPVPLLAAVTFGAPLHLHDGEDKAGFLHRAHAAVAALGDEARS